MSVFLFVRFLGLAALIGGPMVQTTPSLKAGRSLVIAGAAVRLATGIGLLAFPMADSYAAAEVSRQAGVRRHLEGDEIW